LLLGNLNSIIRRIQEDLYKICNYYKFIIITISATKLSYMEIFISFALMKNGTNPIIYGFKKPGAGQRSLK
jgi:hypothetical protein